MCFLDVQRGNILTMMSGWIVKRGTLERQVPDVTTLVRLAREHRLRATDLVFDPTSQQWMNAAEVPDLKDVFESLSTDKPMEPMEPAELGPQNPVEPATTAPVSSPLAPVVMSNLWGGSSRILGFIGGAVAIFGGVKLLALKAAGENSMIEAIAHGLGIYCIGKGLFMIAAVANAKAAVDLVVQQMRRLN